MTAPHQLSTFPPREEGAGGSVAETTPSASGPLPSRAGRYELMEELGRGGMGVVYRAVDPVLQRSLALKIMLASSGDPGPRRRFLDEARITGQLEHPGIPPVHELGRLDDGRPFFAMKLIEGRTLSDLLTERLSPAHELPRFIAIFGQLCQTLAFAHSRGVIHRDLKPSNVMVGAFGEVQVMDWGLAKQMRNDECGIMNEDQGPPLPFIIHHSSFIIPSRQETAVSWVRLHGTRAGTRRDRQPRRARRRLWPGSDPLRHPPG